MKLKQFTIILTEGKIDDIKKIYVDTNKITDQAFNKLIEIDKTDTKKYLQWMCKRMSEERSPQNLTRLESLIPTFETLVNKNKLQGVDKNIDTYKNIESLYDKVKHFEENPEEAKSEKEKERDIKAGAEKIFENDKVLVVKPLTVEASCLYGAGTKWCTAASSSHNRFNQYFNSGGDTFYYVITKLTENVPKNYEKIAVQVSPNGSITAWDAQDTPHKLAEVAPFLKLMEVDFQ